MAQKVELSQLDRQLLQEYGITSLGIKFFTNPFDGIQFPTLPYNFQMLMSDLDWPEKAMGNPNGTLFMHPDKIDDSPANDLGLQCFGDFKNSEFLTMSYNPVKNKNVNNTGKKSDDITAAAQSHSANNESYNQYNLNSVLRYLVEASYNMIGIDIPPEDIKEMNTKYSTLATDVSKAITTYVTRSLSVVNPVVQLVAGSNAKDAMRKVTEVISSGNSTGIDAIKVWIEANDAIEKKKSDKENALNLKVLKTATEHKDKALHFFACLGATDISSNQKAAAYIKSLRNYMLTIKTKDDLKDMFRIYTKWTNYEDFQNYLKDKKVNKDSGICSIDLDKLNFDRINESIQSLKSKRLNEDFDEDDLEGKADATDPIDYDKLYTQIYGILSDTMSDIIGPRAEWTCMKSLEESMKNLKDRADAEITKKIELICKTNGQKSLKKWPFRAEGLLTMWNRYSSELQTRINNRINQLTGSSGSYETGSANMVEDFLRNTYPRIIAAMMTYRLIFEQLSLAYKQDLVTYITLDNEPEIVAAMTEVKSDDIRALISTFDALNNSSQNA